MLHRPAEEHIVDLPLGRLPVATVFPALPSGDGRFQIGRGADGVDRRLLDDDAAIDQALEIDKAESLKGGEAIDRRYPDDAQVLALFEDIQGSRLEIRGADHLEIIGSQQFRSVFVAGPAHDHSPAEGRDPVATVGPVEGMGQRFAVGGAAGIVVFEDDGGRPVHQVLQDVEAVVDIGQVDLARVLAHLEHVLDRDRRDEAVARFDEGAVPENQIAVDQFVQGCLLIGVFSIAHPSLVD